MEKQSSIGPLIKELRLSRKLTQEELARLAGVTFATVNRLEQGSGNPTLHTLEKVLHVLGHKLCSKKSEGIT